MHIHIHIHILFRPSSINRAIVSPYRGAISPPSIGFVCLSFSLTMPLIILTLMNIQPVILRWKPK